MKGSYVLVLHLNKTTPIKIGKKGKQVFPQGWYVYCGSALNGIEQRVQRHLRIKKKMHWHIDYLLKSAPVSKVLYTENQKYPECTLAELFNKKLRPVPGFGCSDCQCISHLYFGTKHHILDCIQRLPLKPYHRDAKS